MQILIKQYGTTLLYGIVAIFCFFLMFSFAGNILNSAKNTVKNYTYTSDVYDKDSVPVITCNASTVEVKRNTNGYSSEDEILNTLTSNNIISIENHEDVTISGSINTKKEGTYNVKITATNNAGKSSKNVAIIVNGDTHWY